MPQENNKWPIEIVMKNAKNPINDVTLIIFQISPTEKDALLSIRQKFASAIFDINEKLLKIDQDNKSNVTN